MLSFARQLEHLGYPGLKAENVNTLQVNLGWRCNQACKHCHLLAGPHRPEQMERDTIDAIIRVVERWSIPMRGPHRGGAGTQPPLPVPGGAPGPSRGPRSSPGAT